jgi:hypothetical protein
VLGVVYRTLFQTADDDGAGQTDPALIRAVLSTVVRYADSSRETDRLSAMQASDALGDKGALALLRGVWGGLSRQSVASQAARWRAWSWCWRTGCCCGHGSTSGP